MLESSLQSGVNFLQNVYERFPGKILNDTLLNLPFSSFKNLKGHHSEGGVDPPFSLPRTGLVIFRCFWREGSCKVSEEIGNDPQY